MGGRIPELDAVRGIAIALVLARHANPGVFGDAGLIGVEVFFVLSGYLITSILIADNEAGRLSLGRFYRNRALRLVPALVCVVAVTAFLRSVVHPLPGTHVASGMVVALTYLTDLRSVFDLHIIPDLDNLWTLAVEEQFYLVWPVVLIGVWYFAARKYRGVVLSLLALASIGEVLVAYTHRGSLQVSQELPLIWAPALLAGCALAHGRTPRVSNTIATLALAMIVGLSFIPSAGTKLVTYWVVVPVIAALSCALIINAASGSGAALLRITWLRRLGLISYGAYLWNYPIAQWFGTWASIPLTIVAAALSYTIVERPFLRRKRHAVDLVAAVSPGTTARKGETTPSTTPASRRLSTLSRQKAQGRRAPADATQIGDGRDEGAQRI
jgi:peptidoglycan/LPS O-acetylase OafA/YrhL